MKKIAAGIGLAAIFLCLLQSFFIPFYNKRQED